MGLRKHRKRSRRWSLVLRLRLLSRLVGTFDHHSSAYTPHFSSPCHTTRNRYSARTRLAADAKSKSGTRQFSGIVDVYKKTYKTDGIVGLYRGFVPSVVGIIVYRGL